MGKTYERIDGRLREFIEAQPVFFVATAPLTGDGTVNLSPKGLRGSLAVLDERTVAYVDMAGSNAETVAHLRENGRITLMWCAFDGPPTIVRVHGRGEPVFRDDVRWPELAAAFPNLDVSRHGPRAIVVVHATLVRDTCGFAVPFMSYDSERDLHARRFEREDDDSLSAYFEGKEHVATSLDGLPGLPLPLPPAPGSRDHRAVTAAGQDDGADGPRRGVGHDKTRGFQ
ncbi:MAG TPA: pyridoxamine 5'-phosphate oxidase family protein [Kineosporiaceae bacterium]|nr:pyridoxamine 5'-phosphate oxidase family protein [Kineosporiaceae bacterium]